MVASHFTSLKGRSVRAACNFSALTSLMNTSRTTSRVGALVYWSPGTPKTGQTRQLLYGCCSESSSWPWSSFAVLQTCTCTPLPMRKFCTLPVLFSVSERILPRKEEPGM